MLIEYKNVHNMFLLNRPMRVEYVDKGIILPQVKDGQQLRWGLGGVCDDENEFVELSFYDGGWAKHGGKYVWSDEEFVDYDAVYFGPFFHHWGHFLIDMIGRLWYFADHENKTDLKLAYLGEEDVDGNFLTFLELLGIREEQLTRVTKPTRFRSVIIPEFSCHSCVWYTKEYRSVFDTIVSRVEQEGYIPPMDTIPEKIYFTRLNFGDAKAKEVGEAQIARWLESNGFTLLAPEKLSVRDQVYLWNNSKEIACLDGTIPLNVAFCRKRALKLMVMHKTSMEHQNPELFMQMRPCDVIFLDAYHEPFRNYPKSLGEGPFLLCIGSDIKQFAAEHNMPIPFTDTQLKREMVINHFRLIWCILGIKKKLRMIISLLIPRPIKHLIRKLRHRYE